MLFILHFLNSIFVLKNVVFFVDYKIGFMIFDIWHGVHYEQQHDCFRNGR